MAKKKPVKPRASASRPERASWRGDFTFGLVSFPVEAFNALDRSASDIHFNQLHAKCHNRIQYQKVCPVHGVVENSEIVSGFEYKKGQYIEMDPDELAELRSPKERGLNIDAFVSQETVDPLYFDGRMYYLIPVGKPAEESYSVVLAAMQKEKRCGVGRIVFSGKDQIVLIRPVESVLHMALLNYEAEIRRPANMSAGLKKASGNSRQMQLAQTLVREWSDDAFDFAAYEDTYRERVQELINSKAKGRKAPEAEEDDDEPVTLNLMEALKKSLSQKRTPARKATKTHKAHPA